MAVLATGVQRFHDRFGRHRRFGEDTPPISSWRCNLCGLSQVNNLFFVAYRDVIHVYGPQFPTQGVSEEPLLIFTSQPSRPNLTGYLDPRNPHAINSLIAQLLGNEEVIAVVRDDGDVDAFLVRHVIQAIERRAEPDSAIGVVADEVKPFFQTNVELTAWGLAIHSEARILATSSNTHEVRVFKFGLLQADDSSDEEENHELPVEQHGEDATARKTDVTHHIINGHSNIPYISFCNTGDDPEGRWLLTTDISGVCRIMDLRDLKQVQCFRFGKSLIMRNTGGFDRLNAGWTIMFLDRRSFQHQASAVAALGLETDESLPGIKRDSDIWDLSKTIQRLPESSNPFVYHEKEAAQTASSPPSADPDEITEEPSLDESMDDHSPDSDSDEGVPLPVDVEIELPSSSPVYEARDEGGTSEGTEGEPEPYEVLTDDAEDPEDEGTEATISATSWYNGESIHANKPKFIFEDGSVCDDLPCPILHASIRNIYLLQPSNRELSQGPYQPPMIGFANPLRQSIHQDFEALRLFERLNMSASIPALGVVVLASQKGRAIVLGLTKLPRGASYPPDLHSYATKSNYAMRAEAILPFAHQEKANERPLAPLHGMAAGPMQGSEDVPDEQKRWRLMMMYQDHSVLSYEITRRTQARDSGVDVESVMI